METSLIKVKKNNITTTSLIVAEKFGKRHDDVLRKIKNLIKDDEKGRLIFAESFYVNSQNKKQKMYIMNRSSFSILCMSFTGKKALEWKMRFYDAFEAMEQTLLRQQNASWQQARIEGKEDRLELTNSIKRLVEFAEASGRRNANRYYTTFTKMIYKILFNIKKVPKDFRNNLDKTTLRQLQLIELKASQWVDDAVVTSDDYHTPYKDVKSRIESLVEVIGGINLYKSLNHESNLQRIA